tara:strand:+ start:106 stop:1059 length:954 start_codon:yes stop_codon:yes gene_type:complete
VKKNIKIKDIDPMIFSGPSDKNLNLLDEHFNSKIVLRGSNLYLEGKKEEIQNIEKVVHDIIYIINKKQNISESEINLLLSSSNNEFLSSSIAEVDEKVILYTHKGAVYARTPGQRKYLEAVVNNDIVFAIGPAGTGKTYQAVALAVSALKNNEVNKIIITRPVVEAGENLGFLPGDLKDKVDPYLTPLYDALDNMLPREKIKQYMADKQIEIAPLAYMRGRTLHNSFIILDEAQNSTHMQMKMFLTRIGVTSKAIITGDITQIDLKGNEISGLVNAISVLENIKGISFVYLDNADIVRHKLVKEIIKAYNKELNKDE